ncbi:MAG: glycosyltransferase family 4 protein [Pseudomonadota bacterium]
MKDSIAFVLKGYPRLSETFIAQEIRGLEKAGLDIRIVSLRRPYDPSIHPIHREIAAEVDYLPEYLHEEPVRVFRSWRAARRLAGFKAAFRAWLKDLRRDISRNRIRRFGQACVLAAELPSRFKRLHAHFMHTPASVTRYASLMMDSPWTCSAHAKDIWTSEDWELREKLKEMGWVSVCTSYGADHLRTLAETPSKVRLVYHGLDLSRFASAGPREEGPDGSDPAVPVHLITVGRAVEKKGLDTLLDAFAKLPPDLNWQWTHVGGGALLKQLKAQAAALGLEGNLDWRGALPQEDVIQLYRDADLFVLPCRVAADGDRDGLPNVLVEAQSQGLACISTPVSGVPELVENDVNGLLVDPDDAAALAGALEDLSRNPARRNMLGAAGERRVRADFSYEGGIEALMDLFSAGVRLNHGN